MQQLINAIIRFKNALVFSVLFLCALVLTSSSSAYHRDVFANWSTSMGSWLHHSTGALRHYINLTKDNQRLTEENKLLLEALLLKNQTGNGEPTPYHVGTASVIRNSFLLDYNYLTLNIGENQHISPEMGVVSAKGIVGVIRHTTPKYAQVMSVLNKDLQVNAKLKTSDHFGSLRWEGGNPTKMRLDDVPNTAPVKVGDTVVTGGMSTIFPAGVPIGTIGGFNQKPLTNFYQIEVDLFQDMTNLGTVYVIENPDRNEIKSLQHITDEQ